MTSTRPRREGRDPEPGRDRFSGFAPLIREEGDSGPDGLGTAYQAGLDRGTRRRRGVFYTPPDVAEGVVALALGGTALGQPGHPTVCDPAVGGAAFLLAAGRRLAEAGHRRREILRDLLWGADIDPAAAAVARAALRAWGAEDGADVDPAHIVVADPIAVGMDAWPDAPVGGFDVVVGNPPFLSPLGTGKNRLAQHSKRLRALSGESAAPYADTAALFLLTACDMAAPGGRVAMIVPESILSARDAGPVRRGLLVRARLVGLWWAGEPVFDVDVRVCAPVLEVGAGPPGRCRLWRGRAFEPAPPAALDRADPAGGGSWSPLLARVRGTPEVVLAPGSVLGSVASATAGFRDQFYGAVPYVVEGAPAGDPASMAPLVTAGLIDPLRCRWGLADARFAGRRWEAPVVDLERLAAQDSTRDRALSAWASDRMVPKLVVATQTRVIEAAVDVEGTWWPSVPTVAVTPVPGSGVDLWGLAAVLTAPPVSAWAMSHFGGAALSGDAIKLSAQQILDIPLPGDAALWAIGAGEARAAHRCASVGDGPGWFAALIRLGNAMTRAYGADVEVMEWWNARLAPWR